MPPSPPPFQVHHQPVAVEGKSRVGSLDNVKHRPGGGAKKVFNDVEYLRSVNGAQSRDRSRSGSRRQSASKVGREEREEEQGRGGGL